MASQILVPMRVGPQSYRTRQGWAVTIWFKATKLKEDEILFLWRILESCFEHLCCHEWQWALPKRKGLEVLYSDLISHKMSNAFIFWSVVKSIQSNNTIVLDTRVHANKCMHVVKSKFMIFSIRKHCVMMKLVCVVIHGSLLSLIFFSISTVFLKSTLFVHKYILSVNIYISLALMTMRVLI